MEERRIYLWKNYSVDANSCTFWRANVWWSCDTRVTEISLESYIRFCFIYASLSLSLSLSRRADESKVHFESRRSRQFQHRPHHASYFRSRFFALEDLRVLTSSLNDLAASAILQSYILVKRKLMETFRNF